MTDADHIVIGGGSSGAALAHRLAKLRPRDRVVLLEAGTYDWSPFIHVPAAIIKAIGNKNLDWMHVAEPDPTRDGRSDLWPAGKVLGGSSSINGMLFVRGQASDYNRWAEAGCDGWSYADVLPIFKRLERTAIGDPDLRGRTGPMHIDRLRTVHPLAHTFISAAKENGVPFNGDYNGASQVGVAYSQVTQTRGWRHHSARGYLWPGTKPRNLKIITRATASGLTFDSDRCSGVTYRKGGERHTLKAAHGVTISAGTMASPKLLMLSGIGPAEHLQELGIDVRRACDAVGRNLQEHPEGMVSIEVNQPTFNTEINSWKIVLHSINWLLFGRGPATSPYPHAVAFMASGGRGDQADVQVQLGPYAFTFDENGVIPHNKPAISAAVNIAYPKSRGRITLRTKQPEDGVRIDHKMFEAEEDLNDLIAACRSVREILAGPAFAETRVAERMPGADVQSDDEWADFLRRTAFLGYHPVGTCRMGSDENSVVTPDLKVRGVTGLRVADASIMPDLPSGNTNGTALMIGEKAADLIAAEC
jgi:choline dehydrogenase